MRQREVRASRVGNEADKQGPHACREPFHLFQSTLMYGDLTLSFVSRDQYSPLASFLASTKTTDLSPMVILLFWGAVRE